MKQVMVRWGTSGLMVLALAACDGGSGQPAAPAVAASEAVPAAPAAVVIEAAPAPQSAVEIAAAPTQAPAAVVSKPAPTPQPAATKPAPTPPSVVVPQPVPAPPPAVTVAAALVPPPEPAVVTVAPAAAVVNAAAPARAAAVDEDAAKALFKKNDCSKCHAVDKDKKGASLKKIAAEFKGKPDAQAQVIKNITTVHKVKFKDGTEEDHKIIDTKDVKELKNLADYILAQ